VSFSVEPIDVFFAFDDPDGFAVCDCLVEFGVPVEGALDAGDAVDPFSGVRVGVLLPEAFVRCADHSIARRAVCVLVQVGDGLLSCRWGGWLADVCPGEVEGFEDVVRVASCVAGEDNGLRYASADGE